MIDRREINIGNYFGFVYIEPPLDPQVYRVRNGFDIDTTSILLSTNSITPIHLTEDILLKCGFKKTIDNRSNKEVFLISKNNCNVIMQNTEFGYCFIWESSFMAAQINSLHELQNIYYWLSGKKELEVKL
jgi:hypothetical protein